MRDKFIEDSDAKAKKTKNLRTDLLRNGLTFDPEKYTFSEDFVPSKPDRPLEAHTTHEMIECMLRDPKIEVEARVLGWDGENRRQVKVGREQFLEWAKRRDSKKLRESARNFREFDGGWNSGFENGSSEIIGSSDFTPMLGGPFNKQLYYRDYLRMIAASFYAFNHDPAAKAVVSILTDFTLGRGFQLHVKHKDPIRAKLAQAMWNAFIEANNFHEQMDSFAMELSIYGESMWWWLPDNNARISFRPSVGETVPKASIPRIRIIDPSNIAEIITIPEDPVQGVLYYVWLAPTQYQMYTRDNQPSTKFIYTQIPADQIMHCKVNCVSNEKRGRSDYFPALGYMKRLRDGVNYALVGQQKAAAWCIDTTIEGDESDFDNYVQYQKQQEHETGEHTAGSEFIHSSAVKREYLANSATSKGGDSPVFSWCLNMIAMASGIPISYLGTHLTGSSNRASALVGVEPVTKRFERRQLVYERTIRKIFMRAMEHFNLDDVDCDIIFPELLTQDRSALLKDLSLAQQNYWIAPSRAAEICNKELDTKDFNYESEMATIKKDEKTLGISALPDGGPGSNPLTDAPTAPQNVDKGPLTSAGKADIKNNLGTL